MRYITLILIVFFISFSYAKEFDGYETNLRIQTTPYGSREMAINMLQSIGNNKIKRSCSERGWYSATGKDMRSSDVDISNISIRKEQYGFVGYALATGVCYRL